MKSFHKILFFIFPILAFTFLSSCKKDWLDAKPKTSLVVPTTIADYQAILDVNLSGSSQGFNDNDNSLGDVGAGDFYVSNSDWNASSQIEQNVYVWNSNVYGSDNNYGEWRVPYQVILNCNIIMEGIDKITPNDNNEQIAWNQVKGSAYFFRAWRHFSIAQEFCKPYSINTAISDLGIPLRLSSDVNVISVRSTVQQTYDAIISDLKQALILLPIQTPINTIYHFRPTKLAANATLARVYLSMGNYDSAYAYSNACLQVFNNLIDYGTLTTSSVRPIPRFNGEEILYMSSTLWTLFTTAKLNIDTVLYNSYNSNDLRKPIYFKALSGNSNIAFTGTYTASSNFFSGLATDEMYLIRAECNARKNNLIAAMQDLNSLLIKRWKPATFIPYTATDSNDALYKILAERRKELVFRAIRWTDLRRLNQESSTAISLIRVINGKTYALPPNDPRYVLPIPDIVVQLSGVQQNSR